MRAFLYYFTHSFIGSVKKLFHNKVIAVILAFVIGFAVIGGVVGLTLSVVFSSVSEESSQTEQVEETETPEEETGPESMTAAEREEFDRLLESAVGGALLLIILLFVYTGDKSGVKIFNMADVNYLFSSPMRPQSVLLFRTVMQMGVVLLSSLYLLGQIPNLMKTGLSLPQCLCLFVGWIMALFIGKVAAVLAYTVVATYPKVRKFLKPAVLMIGAAPVLAVIALIRFGGKGILESIGMVFAAKGARFVPLFGWFQGFIMSLIGGNYLPAAGYFAALILFCVGFSWLIWRIKADFYEDALQGANELQEKTEKARQKGVNTRKKERSAKIARNTEMVGEGAKLFFTKTVYNRRRFAKFTFGTPTALTYACVAALTSAFLRFALQTDIVLPVGIIFCFVIFFRNMGNPLAQEINHPFFFLAPENPFSKVRYALTGGLYECLLDIFPAYIITQLMMRGNSAELLLWLVLWLSLDLLCSLAGLLTELALPSSIVPAIKQMLAVSIRMVAILPGIFLLLLGIVIGLKSAILLIIALNLAVSAALFAIAPRFLHTGKN